LLDLFCGAGGAGVGYHRAGFEVVGVDIKPQKHYPFEFHQADAMTYPLDPQCINLQGFDIIHASPPCQGYANVTRWRGNQFNQPKLIEPIRARLKASGIPYVIENVKTRVLKNPIMLCGSEFGLGIIRHRYFESPYINHRLALACNHSRAMIFEHKQEREFANRMECTWMTSLEGREAIPPAYTEFIGKQLMELFNGN
jgi:DNA (cytosine-5)-methyltransferase 1